MSALALSVLLSVVSALAYAGGAITQEQVAVSSAGSAPVRRPGWWGALALNGLGGVLHVVALAYGPLSLVQPLGALTIVFALPMAALCVGRRAGATAWRGALMATAGLAGLLSLVGSSATHSLTAGQRLAVAPATGAAVAALAFAGLAAHRHPAVRSVLLATASGAAFGMSSVFTKTVAVDWTHGIDLGALPSLGVIGAFSVAGVLLSQLSYRHGGLAAPLATLTVVNPVLAAAVGVLMFGETFRHGTAGTVLALGCGVVAAGGLIMLTTERLEHAEAPESLGTAPADAPADAPVEPTPASPAVPATSPAAAAPAVPAVSPDGPSAVCPLRDVAGPALAAREPRPVVPRQRGAADTDADPNGSGTAARSGTETGGGTRSRNTAESGTGTEAGGAGPPAEDVAPAPYVPLSARFHVPVALPVPVPVPLPAPCARQMATPPARR
ncbi:MULTISPECIES: DMT family transporter [Streptomyces]|uniref:DMT family transporter n=1 Tax=Streptomyces TaxID=1883 RepID=UPI001675D4FE|nr:MULTISPECIES: DMT family transporter [Streptomyces]MBK3522667.1 DMT family transporter [Streptomyces sp. MBT70]GGR84286.1 membrane protein [Streptomyces eurythermus]